MSLDDLSPHRLWGLPRNGIRFFGGFHGVLLSPRAQLFRGFVIAAVVCGGGGRMSVRGVNVQIRSIVMVALGHCVLHIPLSVIALSSGVSHPTVPSAGQLNTVQTAPCFAPTQGGLMDDRYPAKRRLKGSITLSTRRSPPRKRSVVLPSHLVGIDRKFLRSRGIYFSTLFIIVATQDSRREMFGKGMVPNSA
jgi:hypothetical protein